MTTQSDSRFENTAFVVWMEACPDCGAPKGDSCVSDDGRIEYVPHIDRVQATVRKMRGANNGMGS